MGCDGPESNERSGRAVEPDGGQAEAPESPAVAERAGPPRGLTRAELEVELRQSIGRQLYEVLTRPTVERQEPAIEKRRAE